MAAAAVQTSGAVAHLHTLFKQPGDKQHQRCAGGGEDLVCDDGLVFDSLHNGLVEGCQGAQGCDGAAGVGHLACSLPQSQALGVNEQRPGADVPLHQHANLVCHLLYYIFIYQITLFAV